MRVPSVVVRMPVGVPMRLALSMCVHRATFALLRMVVRVVMHLRYCTRASPISRPFRRATGATLITHFDTSHQRII